MSSTASWRTFASALLLALAGCAAPPPAVPQSTSSDDFADLGNWVLESEQPARVLAHAGALDIDAPAGLTLWFRPRLSGAVHIEFDAVAVSAGGPHDQVSDLNVFWMASNRDGSAPFPSRRGGRFAAYDDLRTYYVGLGGNRNTTTRFRRYVGEPGNRPLRPEHDLSSPDALLVPNQRQRIELIADGGRVEYRRDGRPLFTFEDPSPYTCGWFALRTTWSHLRIEKLRIRASEIRTPVRWPGCAKR
jgi:hypothetical protein